MYNILMGLYPNPPMKAAPCPPFSWIWKVVNYLVSMKLKVSMSGQVIFINVTLFGGCGGFDADLYL